MHFKMNRLNEKPIYSNLCCHSKYSNNVSITIPIIRILFETLGLNQSCHCTEDEIQNFRKFHFKRMIYETEVVITKIQILYKEHLGLKEY